MSEARKSSSSAPEPVPAAGETEGGIRAWARDRLGWDDLAHIAAKKRVPVHRYTLFYYLGGMALFLFLVQVATGILLLLYYRPSSAEAFESIQYVMADVPFGWLIRSIHSWGANLFVGVVFASVSGFAREIELKHKVRKLEKRIAELSAPEDP